MLKTGGLKLTGIGWQGVVIVAGEIRMISPTGVASVGVRVVLWWWALVEILRSIGMLHSRESSVALRSIVPLDSIYLT